MYTAIDVVVAARALLANTLWLQGDAAAADQESRLGVEEARVHDHPLSLSFALYQSAWLLQWAGDRDALRGCCREIAALSAEHALWYGDLAGLQLAWADDRPDDLEACLGRLHASGSLLGDTYFYALLVEAQLRTGRVDAAQRTLDDTLALCESRAERLWEPELLRLAGEVALASGAGRASEAEDAFERARSLAERRGAPALALRAATSLDMLHGVAS
jgi:predicted negative regulator of RcsB-dependent stress response